MVVAVYQTITQRISLILLTIIVFNSPSYAGETLVAVATNFSVPAKEIATAFTTFSGHTVRLSFGSTGKLYAQISHGAPFEVFLAADNQRPRMAIDEGLAMAGTDMCYAQGKIVLYSNDVTLIDKQANVLKQAQRFQKIAISNPKTAPYGEAAITLLQTLGVYQSLKNKLVMGDNIGQTYQFVMSGNAQLGIIALSQIILTEGGSRWIVPDNLYDGIEQDAVLLAKGAQNPVAKEFLDFLQSPTAQAIITRYGYGLVCHQPTL